MSLVLLEGLDRTGKSTVAKHFESIGYKVIHMSAPPKGQNADNYLQEMVDIVLSAATNDIILDRSYYGELIWPKIYNRTPLLDDDGMEALRELEEQAGVKRILMHDPNVEAHWQRCVDNNEPLTKAQFTRARSMYSTMGSKYGFESITLPNFCKEFNIDVPGTENLLANKETSDQKRPPSPARATGNTNESSAKKPIDQRLLLEKANAINDVLALSRILKNKGPLYDDLETDIRSFLNGKLAAVFGQPEDKAILTTEEVAFFKAMYKRVIEKEN
jgi:hypothetical protein